MQKNTIRNKSSKAITFPIRVLHVVTKMDRYGLESRIMDIYRNLDRDKIQFDFLTHRNTEGQFDNEIKKMSGRVYYMKKYKALQFISYYRYLMNFFIDKKYYIVHAHLNALSSGILRVAKKNNVPVRIAHSRNSGMDKNFKMLFKIISKQFINKYATHRFACSRQAGMWLFGKRYVYHPSFQVISNSFNLSKFKYNKDIRNSVRKEIGLTDEFSIVSVASLTKQKNHVFLLKIFAKLLERQNNCKLFLIGEGDLRLDIENQIKDMKLDKHVNLLGTRNDIGRLITGMDFMLFPSLYEGFGTVVLESQCNGLLTLASNKLPKETKVTELLEFMSLDNSADQWADKIIDMASVHQRKDRLNDIKEAGYDITDTYKNLQDFYLKSITNS